MKYSFSGMTTAEIEAAKTQLENAIEKKKAEILCLREKLLELQKDRRKAVKILQKRSLSKYNGEYHILGEFRLRHQKTFRELSQEEKREYNKNYYACYRERKKQKILEHKQKQELGDNE